MIILRDPKSTYDKNSRADPNSDSLKTKNGGYFLSRYRVTQDSQPKSKILWTFPLKSETKRLPSALFNTVLNIPANKTCNKN